MSNDELRGRMEKMEGLLTDLHSAVIGPSDGSRVGLVGTCLARQQMGQNLEHRVQKLESEKHERTRRQRVEPAAIATGISTAIIGIVEALRHFWK